MLRVNRTQYKQLQLLYGRIDAQSAKHGVYIVASSEDLTAYQRFLRGDLSRRQKNALRWALKKHHKVLEKPRNN